jgi:hypothetical protein
VWRSSQHQVFAHGRGAPDMVTDPVMLMTGAVGLNTRPGMPLAGTRDVLSFAPDRAIYKIKPLRRRELKVNEMN